MVRAMLVSTSLGTRTGWHMALVARGSSKKERCIFSTLWGALHECLVHGLGYLSISAQTLMGVCALCCVLPQCLMRYWLRVQV